MSGDKTYRCNFCAKTNHQVLALVGGIDAFICDECAALAVQIPPQTSSDVLAYIKAQPVDFAALADRIAKAAGELDGGEIALRKWCIEQALAAGDVDTVDTARRYFEFLTASEPTTAGDPDEFFSPAVEGDRHE